MVKKDRIISNPKAGHNQLCTAIDAIALDILSLSRVIIKLAENGTTPIRAYRKGLAEIGIDISHMNCGALIKFIHIQEAVLRGMQAVWLNRAAKIQSCQKVEDKSEEEHDQMIITQFYSKSSPVIQNTMDKHKGQIVSLQDLITFCDNLEKELKIQEELCKQRLQNTRARITCRQRISRGQLLNTMGTN
uniref:Uncharacterized protein n=1 Tax=Romanomermis culicivorax TaxID=13658 RepID=A0A915J7T1_ROMCU